MHTRLLQSFNVTFGEFSLNLVGDYRVIREKIADSAVQSIVAGTNVTVVNGIVTAVS